MPGRETAPGFLFAVVSPKGPGWSDESKLRKRNNGRSGTDPSHGPGSSRDAVLYFSCI
jgi:hypothetical protein